MPTSPAFSIVLSHFGVWRFGAGLLTLFAAASLLAWWWFTASFDAAAIRIGGAAALLCIAAAAVSTRPRPASLLRWDGRRWHVGAGGPGGAEPVAAELSVAVDLGGWVLLRLHCDGVPRWRATTWLPAQRRGHELQWHAFRCAVYSPRPAPGGPSEADL